MFFRSEIPERPVKWALFFGKKLIGLTKKRALALALGIVLIASNLRAPLTPIGALAEEIEASLGLSAAAAGMLTTIPLLCFGLASPFVGRTRFSLHTGLTIGLSLILLGIPLRACGAAGLFAGTALTGAGIAFGNVLIPAVIKQNFPDRIGQLTAIFTASMNGFAGLALGLSAPLSSHLGWRMTLAAWVVFTIAALLFWLALRPVLPPAPPRRETAKAPSLRRSPLAWWVTVFMGTQSLLYYCFVAWLPSIASAHGFTDAQTGVLAVVYQFAAVLCNLTIPLLTDRFHDQRFLPLCAAVPYTLALIGLLLADTYPLALACTTVAALSQGSMVSLAMCFLGLRTSNARQAAQLSGMAQSLGYFLAAIGPVLTGRLYDMTGSWAPTILLELAGVATLAIAGWFAGQDRKIGDLEGKAYAAQHTRSRA